MRIAVFALPIAAAMLLTTVPAEGHHSWGGTYDVSKQVTLRGKIVEVSLRSPHSFFFIESVDSNGTVQRWSIEGGSVAQFAHQGVTKDVFKVGDPVEVLANPARVDTSYRARMIKITRTTDGKTFGIDPNDPAP